MDKPPGLPLSARIRENQHLAAEGTFSSLDADAFLSFPAPILKQRLELAEIMFLFYIKANKWGIFNKQQFCLSYFEPSYRLKGRIA